MNIGAEASFLLNLVSLPGIGDICWLIRMPYLESVLLDEQIVRF